MTSKKGSIPLEGRSHAFIRTIQFCMLIPCKLSIVKHPTQRLPSTAAKQLQSSRSSGEQPLDTSSPSASPFAFSFRHLLSPITTHWPSRCLKCLGTKVPNAKVSMIVPANGHPTSAPHYSPTSLHHHNLCEPHHEMGLVQVIADQPKTAHDSVGLHNPTWSCTTAHTLLKQPDGQKPTSSYSPAVTAGPRWGFKGWLLNHKASHELVKKTKSLQFFFFVIELSCTCFRWQLLIFMNFVPVSAA